MRKADVSTEMAAGSERQATERLRAAKTRALTFSAAQAFVGAAAPMVIGTGGVIGAMLLGPDKSLATAPVTGFNLGVAIGALPAAWLMGRVGRRNGFMGGAGLTALGGATGAVAIVTGSFWLFAFALMIVGLGGAFVQQYRFAATDGAPPAFRSKAISWVLAGGMFAAIIGPLSVNLTRDLAAPFTFAASYVALIVIAAIGALILSTLRLPQTTNAADEPDDADTLPPRPTLEIITQTQFVVGLICAVGTYALMSFVMTGAPLAMIGAGCTPDEAMLGISWHVMAMFGPSFFTGNLIARFGRDAIVATGLSLLALSALVGLSGDTVWHFWASLILLGFGWNFGFIGATAIVAGTYRASEKSRAEGVHDVILFGSVAFGSLMSGFTYNAAGWHMLNWIVFPVVALCLATLAWGRASAARPVAAE